MPKNPPELTAERLRELLSYDPATGIFRWAVSRGPMSPGDRAGTITAKGYVVIRISRSNFMAHQLAWLIQTGAWPASTVDHRDGNPANNCFDNLRQATHAQNQQNSKVYKNNTNGFPGTYRSKKDGLWKARIQVNGRRIPLGCFKSPQDAYVAYLAGKAEHHTFNPVPRWHRAAKGIR